MNFNDNTFATPFIIQFLKDKIHQERKIANSKEAEDSVPAILKVVDQVNALGEYDRRIGDINLADIYLPTWAKAFIAPVKVTLGVPGSIYEDLVVRPAKEADFVYDEAEIRKGSTLIAGAFKTQPAYQTALEMRTSAGEKALSAVHYAINGNSRQEGNELFVPLTLNPALEQVLGQSWYNITADEMIKRYFLRSFSFLSAKPTERTDEAKKSSD